MSLPLRLAAVVVIVAVAAASTGQPSATPCCAAWNCRENQTFAFIDAGGPFVQLVTYFGNQHECLLHNAKSTQLSTEACNKRGSIWSYGPGSITDYVYYNSTDKNLCLSLDIVSEPSHQPILSEQLTLAKCCASRGVNCTETEKDAQLWLEPDTTHNAYSVIRSKLTTSDAPDGYCFTRG